MQGKNIINNFMLKKNMCLSNGRNTLYSPCMKCSCTVCSCVSRYHFFLSNWSFKLVVDSPCGVNNRKKKLPLIEPPNLGTPPPKKRKIGRNDGTGEVIYLFIILKCVTYLWWWEVVVLVYDYVNKNTNKKYWKPFKFSHQFIISE